MKINSYKFGKIVVDSREYKEDIIIFPSRIKNWWRKEGHLLQLEDLEEVFKIKPKKLIVGTGAYGSMKVDEKVKERCKELGTKLIAEKTEEACQLYNQLSEKEKKNTVLAVHLTC